MFKRRSTEGFVTKPKSIETVPVTSPKPGCYPEEFPDCSGDFSMETASLENSQKKDFEDNASRDFLEPKLTDVSYRSERRRDITLQEAMDILKSSETTIDESFSIELQEQPLSQPPKNIRHRERLEWLQNRRGYDGIWTQCDHCNKWRYLKNIQDPTELPDKWYCEMNPDLKFNSCDASEKGPTIQEEVQMIHNLYTAGSVVWAKLGNYPWWPAMVDDDPDCETFYWLNGISDTPTYYNVVFFDSLPVTRTWVSVKFLKSYRLNPNLDKTFCQKISKSLRQRITVAKTQAQDALTLNIPQRLKKWSFLSRYDKPIITPPESFDDVSDYGQQPGTAFDFDKFKKIFLKKRAMKKRKVAYKPESSTENESNTDAINEKSVINKRAGRKKYRGKYSKKDQKRTVRNKDSNSKKIFMELNQCVDEITDLSQTLNDKIEDKPKKQTRGKKENVYKKKNNSGKENINESIKSGEGKIRGGKSKNMRSKRSHSTDSEGKTNKRLYKREDLFKVKKRLIITSDSELSGDLGRRRFKRLNMEENVEHRDDISDEDSSDDVREENTYEDTQEKISQDSIHLKLNQVKKKLMNVMYEVSCNQLTGDNKKKPGELRKSTTETEVDSDLPLFDYVKRLEKSRKRRDSMLLESDSGDDVGEEKQNHEDIVQRRVRKDSYVLTEDSDDEVGYNKKVCKDTKSKEFDFGSESVMKTSESRMKSGTKEQKSVSGFGPELESSTKMESGRKKSGKKSIDSSLKKGFGPDSEMKSRRELRDRNKPKIIDDKDDETKMGDDDKKMKKGTKKNNENIGSKRNLRSGQRDDQIQDDKTRKLEGSTEKSEKGKKPIKSDNHNNQNGKKSEEFDNKSGRKSDDDQIQNRNPEEKSDKKSGKEINKKRIQSEKNSENIEKSRDEKTEKPRDGNTNGPKDEHETLKRDDKKSKNRSVGEKFESGDKSNQKDVPEKSVEGKNKSMEQQRDENVKTDDEKSKGTEDRRKSWSGITQPEKKDENSCNDKSIRRRSTQINDEKTFSTNRRSNDNKIGEKSQSVNDLNSQSSDGKKSSGSINFSSSQFRMRSIGLRRPKPKIISNERVKIENSTISNDFDHREKEKSIGESNKNRPDQSRDENNENTKKSRGENSYGPRDESTDRSRDITGPRGDPKNIRSENTPIPGDSEISNSLETQIGNNFENNHEIPSIKTGRNILENDSEIPNSLETKIGNDLDDDSQISNSLETETGNSCVLDGDVIKKTRRAQKTTYLPSEISESSSHLPNSSISFQTEPSTSKFHSHFKPDQKYNFINESNSESSESLKIFTGDNEEDLDTSIRSMLSGLSKMEEYPCELPNLSDDIIDDIQIVPGDDDNIEEIRRFITQSSIGSDIL